MRAFGIAIRLPWLVATCVALACGCQPSAAVPSAAPPEGAVIVHPTPVGSHADSHAPPANLSVAAPPANSSVTAPPRTKKASDDDTSASADRSFDPGLANLDPEDDDVVGPPEAIPDCELRLRAAGIRYRLTKIPIVRRRDLLCGAPQVVEYIEGPEHIQFRPRPIVTCQLALALARFEGLLNRTAREVLGTSVTSVQQGGTYNCRAMARFRLVSEHSYANAIDLYGFGLSGARTVSVQRHFGRPSEAAGTPEARFLRTLAQRAFDENVFSVVVTRYFDELHRDHVHVDMAHYRTDGSR